MRFGAGDPRTYTGLSPTMLIFVNMTTGATLAAPAVSESLTGSGIYQFQWGTTTPIAFLADAATTSPGAQGRYVAGQLDPADRSNEYGTTLVAIGTTNIALGTTAVYLSNAASAIGQTLTQAQANLGTTLIAIGTTNIALGTTAVYLSNAGTAVGQTLTQIQTNMGTTLVSIGNTLAGIGTSLSIIVPAIGSTASSFGNSTTDPGTLFGYLKRIQENLEGNSNFVKVSGIWSISDRASSVTLAVKTIVNSATMVQKS